MSRWARLAEFFSIWLKKHAVPIGDVVALGTILPSARLAYSALMPVVIANIQSRLRQVVAAFLESLMKTPRVNLVYKYLAAWYILHCLALMTPKPPHGAPELFVQCLAECTRTSSSLLSIRKIFSAPGHYQLYWCPPKFEGTTGGTSFIDLPKDDEFTMLSPGPFTWLLNIRPG